MPGRLYQAIPSLNLGLFLCDREQVDAYRAVPCPAEHRGLFRSGFASICTLSVLCDKMIPLSLPNLELWDGTPSGREWLMVPPIGALNVL